MRRASFTVTDTWNGEVYDNLSAMEVMTLTSITRNYLQRITNTGKQIRRRYLIEGDVNDVKPQCGATVSGTVFRENDVIEWNNMRKAADLIKQGKAKIITAKDGRKYTVLKENVE
jgi:hypothetical protein